MRGILAALGGGDGESIEAAADTPIAPTQP